MSNNKLTSCNLWSKRGIISFIHMLTNLFQKPSYVIVRLHILLYNKSWTGFGGDEMNPEEVTKKLSGRKPTILDYDRLRKHAILLPLIEIDKETHILFEVRSMELRTQPGDICFPGGRMDMTDPDAEFCAIRETTEELGINQTMIQDVHPLDYIVSDNGRMIYPFTGII